MNTWLRTQALPPTVTAIMDGESQQMIVVIINTSQEDRGSVGRKSSSVRTEERAGP